MWKRRKRKIPLADHEAVLSDDDRTKFKDEMLRREVGELRKKKKFGVWATAIASIILAVGAIATLALQMSQQMKQAEQNRLELNELQKNRTTENITNLILSLGEEESQKRHAALSALWIYLNKEAYDEFREDIIGAIGELLNTETDLAVKNKLTSVAAKLRGEGEAMIIVVEDKLKESISIASKEELTLIIIAQGKQEKVGLPLSGLDLSEIDLSGANLKLADLKGANLSDTTLKGADLSGAILAYADLSDADLSGAILAYADLSGANLVRANLDNAILTNTILHKADLSRAKLDGTELRNADFSGAVLANASFEHVRNFRSAKLEGVEYEGIKGLSEYLQHSAWGFPLPQKKALNNIGYIVSYDPNWKIPHWVSYHLTKDYVNADKLLKNRQNYKPDPVLPAQQRADSKDYSKSGYDRGHIVSQNDLKGRDKQCELEAWYMTNITPQNRFFNQRIWALLDKKVQNWAIKYGKVWVIAGPIFADGKVVETIGKNKVAVPTHFYKLVVRKDNNSPKILAFVIPNDASRDYKLASSLVSVDMVEELTGLNFFHELPDDIESTLEEVIPLKLWNN